MAGLHTNETVFATAGFDTTNLEFPELEIPILTGIQRQGDLVLVPTGALTGTSSGESIRAGIAVVGQDGSAGNAHIVIGDGSWHRFDGDDLVEGRVTVPEGGEAFLIHTEEHNALGLGPGTYEIRRQREWDPAAASAEFDQRVEAERRRIADELIAYRRIRD
jgi:hypothetical protein